MKRYVIALDIGGTNMRCALFLKDKVLEQTSFSTPKRRGEFLKKLESLIDKYDSRKVRGIGVGIAGQIKNGVVVSSPNLPIRKFNLKKHLEIKYRKKVEVSNDASCFTLAELELGSKLSNFILITLGTGIGGGIVVNSSVYRGQGYGGEFGHMYVNGKDWESLWKKTRRRIRKQYPNEHLMKDLVKIKGKDCKSILDESADYLGQGIASLISAFDPEAVFIGGGLRESGNVFLNMIKKKVEKYKFLPRKTRISWTTFSNPGIYGARLLIK